MKLSYAVCGVMTTASFDDGFDAIATSSEITSHTILDARQCQERRNADGLFLRERSAERRVGRAIAVARQYRAQNYHNAPKTRCRALLGARQSQERHKATGLFLHEK